MISTPLASTIEKSSATKFPCYSSKNLSRLASIVFIYISVWSCFFGRILQLYLSLVSLRVCMGIYAYVTKSVLVPLVKHNKKLCSTPCWSQISVNILMAHINLHPNWDFLCQAFPIFCSCTLLSTLKSVSIGMGLFRKLSYVCRMEKKIYEVPQTSSPLSPIKWCPLIYFCCW